MKSEMKMPRDRDREVIKEKNSREFSRNETLAGYCNAIHEASSGEVFHVKVAPQQVAKLN